MKVSYHVFNDYKIPVELRSDEDLLEQSPEVQEELRRNRYSFVCSVYHSRRNKLYLGATNCAGDILIEFDVATKKFRSCGCGGSGILGPDDSKIHKGLHLDEVNDAIYFGTATLSSLPKIIETNGGVIARYDIRKDSFTRLGHPIRGEFYQSTCWDLHRKLAYLFTSRMCFGVYDFGVGRLVRQESMESIPHNSCLDDAGGVWGTYSCEKHAFFRFNPNTMKFEFPGIAFASAVAAANVQYPGAGPVDCMINGQDGYIYVSNALGELHRIEPRHGKLAYLGKPFAQRRLPGMALGSDGWLYLSGGHRPDSMLARYNRRDGRFEYLGKIKHADGTRLEYVHDITVVGNSVFALETDNTTRNGYLWECEIDK